MEPPAKKTRINHVSSPAKPSRFPVLNYDVYTECTNVLMIVV